MAMGFPDSSVGKESACNAGDPGLIPMLGKSAGEGAVPILDSFCLILTSKSSLSLWIPNNIL